jgi:hypothetical protein
LVALSLTIQIKSKSVTPIRPFSSNLRISSGALATGEPSCRVGSGLTRKHQPNCVKQTPLLIYPYRQWRREKKSFFQHCLPGQFRGRQASPNFSTCGRSIRETDPPPFTSPTRPRNRPICIAAGLEFKKLLFWMCFFISPVLFYFVLLPICLESVFRSANSPHQWLKRDVEQKWSLIQSCVMPSVI